MSKVTLEDVAQLIDDAVEVCQINGQQEFTPIFGQHMALVRAAAEVVEAVRPFGTFGYDVPDDAIVTLFKALCYFDAISEGEKP